MRFFNTFFEMVRGCIDLLGLYESSRFRRGLDEENRNLRENLQLERMRNLSMEGQVSMVYSTLNQMHEENREFIKLVTESSQVGMDDSPEEDEEEGNSLEERIEVLEEILTGISLQKLDNLADESTCKECTCNCGGEEALQTDMENPL